MSQCCCCFVLLGAAAVTTLVGGGGKLLLAGEFSHSSAGSRLPPSHSAWGGTTGPYKIAVKYFVIIWIFRRDFKINKIIEREGVK